MRIFKRAIVILVAVFVLAFVLAVIQVTFGQLFGEVPTSFLLFKFFVITAIVPVCLYFFFTRGKK